MLSAKKQIYFFAKERGIGFWDSDKIRLIDFKKKKKNPKNAFFWRIREKKNSLLRSWKSHHKVIWFDFDAFDFDFDALEILKKYQNFFISA